MRRNLVAITVKKVPRESLSRAKVVKNSRARKTRTASLMGKRVTGARIPKSKMDSLLRPTKVGLREKEEKALETITSVTISSNTLVAESAVLSSSGVANPITNKEHATMITFPPDSAEKTSKAATPITSGEDGENLDGEEVAVAAAVGTPGEAHPRTRDSPATLIREKTPLATTGKGHLLPAQVLLPQVLRQSSQGTSLSSSKTPISKSSTSSSNEGGGARALPVTHLENLSAPPVLRRIIGVPWTEGALALGALTPTGRG